jgi:predicted nucleic acid-binding protein
VLSWLLGEDGSEGVREALASAELVLASDLTLIECDRVLIRATGRGRLSEAQAADRRGRLGLVAQHWTILSLDDEIVDRARRPFPREPIRTLDAIHLSTALVARTHVSEPCLLSLDERIRSCARELGFHVIPG